MTITVQGPDGVTIDFPEGTDHETINRVMTQAVTKKPAESAAVLPDVAKSAGIGVAKGGIGLAGLAGDVRNLAAAGVDYAGKKLGFDPEPVKSAASTVANLIPGAGMVLNNAPSSQDIQSKIEGVTGEFYKPKTTAGEYAQTAGEFLPAIIGGPETIATKLATRVAAPAIMSETAGQVTKGTAAEPYARLLGAVLGAGAPAVARRAITPFPAAPPSVAGMAPERQALVNALRGEGIELTAGQATGNKPLQWMESAMGDLPGTGGMAADAQMRQAEQFTAAALRRAGERANRATPEVINNAFDRIGNQFETIGSRNHVAPDQQFIDDLVRVRDDYRDLVGPHARAPVVENTINDIANQMGRSGGVLTGEQYNAMTSRIGKLARASKNDPQLQTALQDIKNTLDDAFERTLQASGNVADYQALREARNQYRNLMVIEKAATGAGSQTAEGLISPSQLRNATVNEHGRRNFARGQGDFAELSRAGEAIMKPLPNSGTAPRLYAQHLISLLSAGGGASLAGLPGAIAGGAVPATVGRLLMSHPVQSYLMNQRLAAPAAAGTTRNRALAAALVARPTTAQGSQ